MRKAKLIFIEGVDRAGKTSLISAIHKITNYKHVIFDRGVISNMVYTAKNRFNEEIMASYEALENQLSLTNHLVIHVTCDSNEIMKRIKATNHEDVDIETDKQLFDTFIATTSLNVVKVDTTNMSQDEIAKSLKEKGYI